MVSPGSTSRYESVLRSQLPDIPTAAQIETLNLRVSAYLARKGDFSEARKIVSDVRSRAEGRYSPLIYCGINYAEGVIEYFDHGFEAAIDKLQRSIALSTGCSADNDLPSLVFAWMAACRRLQGRWSDQFSNLQLAVQKAGSLSHETLERVCLVVSDSMQETCLYDAARKWYDVSRQHALNAGDDSAISAMLYNRAAIRLFNERIQQALGGAVDLAACQADLAAYSAENYTKYVRETSMAWVFRLLRGQIHLLRGEWAPALAALDDGSVSSRTMSWPAVEIVRSSDVLLLRSHLNLLSFPELRQLSINAIEKFGSKVGPGDLAIATDSLARAHDTLLSADSEIYRSMAVQALTDLDLGRKSEVDALNVFLNWLQESSKLHIVSPQMQ